ncbi:MAG: hypothetical protein J6N32_02145, partial [Clostridia bacterium]|nr:hypothetical protein [Clostridia bacterium]
MSFSVSDGGILGEKLFEKSFSAKLFSKTLNIYQILYKEKLIKYYNLQSHSSDEADRFVHSCDSDFRERLDAA